MTYNDLFQYNSALTKPSVQQYVGVKFAYAVAKNLDKIKREIRYLQDASEPTEDYKKYDQERHAICKEYCDKNEKGEPVVIDGNFSFTDEKKKKEFDQKIEELRQEYEITLEERQKQVKEVEKMLSEEIKNPIEFFKITQENLPSNITAEDLFALSFMISDF